MSQQPRSRRRLETAEEGESRVGRGCLIWGGVLGILIGAAFGYYGLKPILKHFYGESTVAAGAAYSGGGKTIRVQGVGTNTDPGAAPCTRVSGDPASIVCVTLNISAANEWQGLTAKQFTLQVGSQHNWIDAATISGAGDPVVIRAGKPVTLSVHFPAPSDSSSANLEYLHLASPRVRFALAK